MKSGLLMECVKIDGEAKLIGVPLQDQSPDRLPKQDWDFGTQPCHDGPLNLFELVGRQLDR